MKITLIIIILSLTSFLFADSIASDLTPDHFAYKEIVKLINEGIMPVYSHRRFEANKPVSRYETALALYKLAEKIEKGHLQVSTGNLKTVQQLILNFKDELNILTQRTIIAGKDFEEIEKNLTELNKKMTILEKGASAHAVSKNIEVSGDLTINSGYRSFEKDTNNDDWENYLKLGLNFGYEVNPDNFIALRIRGTGFFGNSIGEDHLFSRMLIRSNENPAQKLEDLSLSIGYGYLYSKNVFKSFDASLGRQDISTGNRLVLHSPLDSVILKKEFGNLLTEAFIYSRYNDSITNNIPVNGISGGGIQLSWNADDLITKLYFLSEHFDRFNPYEGSINPDKSDPFWAGFSMNGNLYKNIDFFMETAFFKNQAETVQSFSGNAWLAGVSVEFSPSWQMIFQLGTGDEEFLPSEIKIDESFNTMSGRWNPDNNPPSASLQGIKDILFKINYKPQKFFNAWLKYEIARKNETNTTLNLSPDTNHSEYREFVLGGSYKYSSTTMIDVIFRDMQYEDPLTTLIENGGSFQEFRTGLKINF